VQIVERPTLNLILMVAVKNLHHHFWILQLAKGVKSHLLWP
jgi:hypothetical protein